MSVLPRAAESQMNEAIRHHRLGATDAAERIYRDLVRQHPDSAAITHDYCQLLAATNRLRAAQNRLEGFLKRSPSTDGTGRLHHLLATVLERQKLHARCLFHYGASIKLDPGHAGAHVDLVRCLAEQRKLEEARRIAAAAMTRFPENAALPYFLGAGELLEHNTDAAARLFETAVALDPKHHFALYNLATIYEARSELDEAIRLYRAAEAADRNGELPPVNLGDIELRTGDVAASIASSEAWLARWPDDSAVWGNRLLAAHYHPAATPEQLLRLNCLWNDRVARTLQRPATPWQDAPRPDQRLRIGVVSADLHSHPVAFLTIRAFEALDPGEFDITAYYGGGVDDAMSRRFARAATAWHGTAGWPDERLHRQIMQDRIDILLDLSGHTAGSRLPVFARRAAPVQIAWLGYPGTTGLSTMDWLVADPYLIPAGDDACYVERILRLPRPCICFDPPAAAPEVSALPAGDSRPLTFAAFHNPAKINGEVAALWTRVLLNEPGSSIRFVYSGFQFPSVQQRIRGQFAAAGVDGDRLSFTGKVARDSLLDLYGTTDIALDTFPYSGMTTTAEALWMGVPVVTLPGRTFASRNSLCTLSAAGLAGTVARDADDYVAIVHALGADRAGLGALRAGLRQRMAASPLCDGRQLAADLGSALKRIWQERTMPASGTQGSLAVDRRAAP